MFSKIKLFTEVSSSHIPTSTTRFLMQILILQLTWTFGGRRQWHRRVGYFCLISGGDRNSHQSIVVVFCVILDNDLKSTGAVCHFVMWLDRGWRRRWRTLTNGIQLGHYHCTWCECVSMQTQNQHGKHESWEGHPLDDPLRFGHV